MASHYTTLEDVIDYLERDGSDWSSLTQGAVEIAEEDVDYEISSPYYDETTMRSITVGNLDQMEELFLAQAVAEQARYRALMPAQLFIAKERARSSQDGSTVEGTVGRFSPIAAEKLSRGGFYRLGATAARLGFTEGLFPGQVTNRIDFPPFDSGM